MNTTGVGDQKNAASAEMGSQQGEGVEERVQITNFSDDMAIIPEHVPGESILPPMDTLQHTDSMTHSIISFLERPQLISVFNWKSMSTDKHGQNILAFMDPSDPSKTLLNPLVPSQVMTNMVLEKLQGFTSFRATAVFKLQINAEPFQAGRLIFGVVPMPTLLGERADFIMKTPCSALSVNHVQMDINKQTEVELRVPFISPFNSYDLINQQFDWARLFCMVYAPLNVVGEDNMLDCNLWFHFEDIELGCPTSAKCTILPAYNPTRTCYWGEATSQGGSPKKEKKNKPDIEKHVKSMTDSYLERKKRKLEDKKLKIDRVFKIDKNNYYLPIATSQSGKPDNILNIDPNSSYSKGNFLGAWYLKANSNWNFALPSGVYFVDIYTTTPNSADNTGYLTQSGNFNIGMSPDQTLSWSGPLQINTGNMGWATYNDGCAAFVYVFSSVKTSEPIQVQITNTTDNPAQVSFPEPVWIVDHNQSPVSTPPGTPEPSEIYPPDSDPNIVTRRYARSQSGWGLGAKYDRFSGSGYKSYRSTPRLKRKVKTPRVPPKEASPKAVEEQREEEADGNFAKGVKKFAGKVNSAVTSVGDVIASVGNWFGWSKPQLSHAGETVVVRPTQYFGNTNGIDHSHVLSLDLLNNVDEYPSLCGTDLDELSFDFIKRVPQFIGAFQYNLKSRISTNASTNVGNDYLWSCFVLPNYINPACYRIQYAGSFGDDNITASNVFPIENPTSLGYAISPFTYWTGSLVYTFRFAKTDFNSGRVEISYHPFLYSNKIGTQQRNFPVPDNQRFEYAYKLVIDLRENSEVSFTVPYISPQPWKALAYYQQRYFTNPYADGAMSSLEINEISRCSTGLLWVRALTPLHTQSSVAPTSILCLVEVRAGDDFQVQCPSVSRYMPIATSQAGRVYATPGTEDTRTRALEGFVPPSITGSDVDIEREDTQRYCAGEAFDNYRSFIKRNMFVRLLSQYRPSQCVNLYPNEFIVPPRLSVNIYQTKPSASEKQVSVQVFKLPNWPSPMSFISAMYTFYRGGVRFKIVPTTESGGLTCLRLVTDPYRGTPQVKRPTTLMTTPYQTFMSPVQYEQNDKRICEYQVPYYSPTLQSCHWTIRGGYLFDNPLPYLQLTDSNVTNNIKTASFFHIATSAADDFDLGLFLGAPLSFFSESYHDQFEYTLTKTIDGKPTTTLKSADWFSSGNSYDNIQKADPCYIANPFAGTFTDPNPTNSDFEKVSTQDLPISLNNIIVSNPDLTVTNDPGKLFRAGCSF